MKFNSLDEIADALTYGRITKRQAFDIVRVAITDRPVTAFSENGEIVGTPEGIAENIRDFKRRIKEQKGFLIINLPIK